jgi:serine protease Do
MTGWMTATAAMALVGAAGIGSTLGPARSSAAPQVRRTQAVRIAQDEGPRVWTVEPEQGAVFFGSGSQIGISIRDLADDDTKAKTVTNGVVVEDVEADSPASKAGLKVGDIVTEYDGERVRSMRQFIRLVQETVAGHQVQIAAMRDGQRVTMSVQPRSGSNVKYFDSFVSPKLPPAIAKHDFDFMPKLDILINGSGRLGITVDELTAQLAEYFGTKDGVLVKSVNDASPASKAGLRAGDVITALNGGTVTSTGELRRLTQRLDNGEEFTVAVMRDKKPLTLKGKIDAPAARKSTVRTVI